MARLFQPLAHISSSSQIDTGVIASANLGLTQPTRQTLTVGTAATYTKPAGVKRLFIRMIGGGGGGAASSVNAGSDGGDTIFDIGGAAVTAKAGKGCAAVGGPATVVGGAGGSGGTGTGTGILRMPGGGGDAGHYAGGSFYNAASRGGSSAFGCAPAATTENTAGISAPANTGAGGGGAGCASANYLGGGGGAGEYVEFSVNAPAATYTYTIGAGGNGGAAGTFAGGNGGSGIIIVDEY